MGIQSLWKVLEAVKESKSLLALAEEHRTHALSTGIEGRDAVLTLGVDMGACMAECNAGALAAGVNYQQAGGGLYVFFKKLAEFMKAPVALVFVFDGPERPHFKRGHEVQQRPIWWTDLAIELIEYFGYQIHRAPGEAEAELAKLNAEGHVHAIITSDGDAFPFGTQLLLRSVPKKERKYPLQYSVYSANKAEFPLTQGGLILYALLSGGDYNCGVKSCGSTTALALARCGFGDQLLSALHNLHGTDYERFLIGWRCAIRSELLTNTQGFLTRRQPSVAAAILDSFPDARILGLYTNPVTSWSPGRTPPDPSRWVFKQPSIPAITRFCNWHFRWRTSQVLKQNFKLYLWEGIFLQMLYSSSATYNSEQGRLQLPGPDSRHADVLSISRQPRRGQFKQIYGAEPQPKLVVSTANFIDLMGLGFTVTSADYITVWPLASLLPPLLQQLGKSSTKEATLQVPPYLHAVVDGIKNEWVQIEENRWFIDLTSED